VHRDVTPANVLVTAASEVKLTDFGLSKSYGDPLLTTCGEVLGSLPYLAPEQLKGTTQPDRRSDLYSVGAILYEHLTGQKPFGANRRLAPVLTDSEDEPKPPSQLEPSLSPQWDEILRRALARDPAHRYQSAEEFLDAIARPIKPAAADLPLPQLRTLGIGIGAVVVLALAFVASPAYSRFRQVAPVTTEVQRLHIAPPAFATAMRPHGAPAPVGTTRRVATHAAVQHAKRTARSVPASVPEPHPAVEASKHQQQTAAPPTASTALTVPAAVPAPSALTTPTARSAPAGSLPSAETPSAPASAGQDANQPVASQAEESGVSPAPTPAKKHFWNKLNVFKKKKSEPNEDQQ
jgi:serine/threonine-protein kinase